MCIKNSVPEKTGGMENGVYDRSKKTRHIGKSGKRFKSNFGCQKHTFGSINDPAWGRNCYPERVPDDFYKLRPSWNAVPVEP